MEFDDDIRAGKGRADRTDAEIGDRIRQRRTLLRMSQEQLADKLGITFQQVQKYERGANRVAASRLKDIAAALGVGTGYFYGEAPRLVGLAETQEGLDDPLGELLARRETQDLIRAYWRIGDEAMRKRMLDLIKSMAGTEEATANR